MHNHCIKSLIFGLIHLECINIWKHTHTHTYTHDLKYNTINIKTEHEKFLHNFYAPHTYYKWIVIQVDCNIHVHFPWRQVFLSYKWIVIQISECHKLIWLSPFFLKSLVKTIVINGIKIFSQLLTIHEHYKLLSLSLRCENSWPSDISIHYS